MIIITATEILLVIKFGLNIISKPLPIYKALLWILFIIAVVIWTIWNFYIKQYFIDIQNKLLNNKSD